MHFCSQMCSLLRTCLFPFIEVPARFVLPLFYQLITNDRKARQGGDQERSVHPMQFGRRYAASLLQMMHRVDWKRCTGTIEEETRSADAIREGFAKYDPMGKATDERK